MKVALKYLSKIVNQTAPEKFKLKLSVPKDYFDDFENFENDLKAERIQEIEVMFLFIYAMRF